MRYTLIKNNCKDTEVDITQFNAGNDDNAINKVIEESHNYENYLLFDEFQLPNFLQEVERLKSRLEAEDDNLLADFEREILDQAQAKKLDSNDNAEDD